MELVRGQLVTSRKGRDVTGAYVVLGQEAGRALLCNGETRTLAAPKRKNPLHLQPVNQVLPEEELKTDLAVKMAIKAFNAGRKAEKGG